MPGIVRPRAVDKKDPRFFSLRTAQVRATKETAADGDKYFIEGIASSTVQDCYGDILTEACQVSMLEQCRGMTSWLNHSYDVPEDILGTIVEATLLKGSAGDGTGRDNGEPGTCVDLHIKIEIDPSNPRALKVWNAVNNGTRLAFSIGGWFTDIEIEQDDDGNLLFLVNDIELLEVSCVGLPANPRAYTKVLEYATETMRKYVVQRAEAMLKSAVSTDAKLADCADIVVKSMLGKTAAAEPVADADDVDCAACAASLAAAGPKCEEHAAEPVADPGDEPVGGDALAVPATRDSGDTSDDHPAPSSLTIKLEGDDKATELGAATKEAVHAWLAKLAAGADIFVTFGISDPAERRDLTDMQVQACVSALKCIKEAVDHGMCTQAEGSARSAHAIVKAMLPDDYDIPEDAQLGDAGETASALDVRMADLQMQLDGKTAELTTISAERDALKQEVETLKASPAGRLTKSSFSNGSSNTEPTASPDLYYKSHGELAATAAFHASNSGSDARARMQRI